MAVDAAQVRSDEDVCGQGRIVVRDAHRGEDRLDRGLQGVRANTDGLALSDLELLQHSAPPLQSEPTPEVTPTMTLPTSPGIARRGG